MSHEAYTTLEPGNVLGQLQEALELAEKFAPAERRLRQAQKEGLIHSDYLGEQIDEAEHAEVISKKEARELHDYHDKVRALLAVDDFAPEELGRPANQAVVPNTVRKKTAARKKPTRKKTKRKKVSKKAK